MQYIFFFVNLFNKAKNEMKKLIKEIAKVNGIDIMKLSKIQVFGNKGFSVALCNGYVFEVFSGHSNDNIQKMINEGKNK